jgi:hypothetical protein
MALPPRMDAILLAGVNKVAEESHETTSHGEMDLEPAAISGEPSGAGTVRPRTYIAVRGQSCHGAAFFSIRQGHLQSIRIFSRGV